MTMEQAAAQLTQGRMAAQQALPAGGQHQLPGPAMSTQPAQALPPEQPGPAIHPVEPAQVQPVPGPYQHPQAAPLPAAEPAPAPQPPLQPVPPPPPLPAAARLRPRQQMGIDRALCSRRLGAFGRKLGAVAYSGPLRPVGPLELWACEPVCASRGATL